MNTYSSYRFINFTDILTLIGVINAVKFLINTINYVVNHKAMIKKYLCLTWLYTSFPFVILYLIHRFNKLLKDPEFVKLLENTKQDNQRETDH